METKINNNVQYNKEALDIIEEIKNILLELQFNSKNKRLTYTEKV